MAARVYSLSTETFFSEALSRNNKLPTLSRPKTIRNYKFSISSLHCVMTAS